MNADEKKMREALTTITAALRELTPAAAARVLAAAAVFVNVETRVVEQLKGVH